MKMKKKESPTFSRVKEVSIMCVCVCVFGYSVADGTDGNW